MLCSGWSEYCHKCAGNTCSYYAQQFVSSDSELHCSNPAMQGRKIEKRGSEVMHGCMDMHCARLDAKKQARIMKYIGSKSGLGLPITWDHYAVRPDSPSAGLRRHTTRHRQCETCKKWLGKLDGIIRNKTMQLVWKMGMWGVLNPSSKLGLDCQNHIGKLRELPTVPVWQFKQRTSVPYSAMQMIMKHANKLAQT